MSVTGRNLDGRQTQGVFIVDTGAVREQIFDNVSISALCRSMERRVSIVISVIDGGCVYLNDVVHHADQNIAEIIIPNNNNYIVFLKVWKLVILLLWCYEILLHHPVKKNAVNLIINFTIALGQVPLIYLLLKIDEFFYICPVK